MFSYLLIIQLRPESGKVKRYLISGITNLAHELPYEFPNDLRLKILENYELLEKCQMRGQTQPSTQFSFHKLNIDNSCKKHAKLDIIFLKSLCGKYFVQDCLSKQIFGSNLARSPSHLNLLIISVTSKHFSDHDQNIKQVSCVKSSKFNGFMLELFCILGLGQNLTLENF